MNVEEFFDSFLQFEDECGMFDISIGNVKIWHLIRRHLYYDLADVFGVVLSSLTGASTGGYGEINKTWKDVLREKVVCNQFLAHRRDVLIIPQGRKYRDKGDCYSCYITGRLERAMKRSHYLLDGKSVGGVYLKWRSRNILYLKWDVFLEINRKKKYYQAGKQEVEEKIIEPIENFYNIRLDLKCKRKWLALINNILRDRDGYISYFDFMLKRIKPKIIILACAYDTYKMILCEVAQKRNIPVIELQHGAIGTLHIAYNFLNKRRLPNFPSYIFTFGQLDKITPRYPIDNERIIPVGYPELENNYKKYCRANQKKVNGKKQILFVSQGLTEIARYAEKITNMLDINQYRIIFKLHPKEYGNWKQIYGKYLHNPNIEVVGDYNKTIYSYLGEADWVIGNCSTTLYEATMFNTKIAIIKDAQYLNMKPLYENGLCLLVNSPEELADNIISDVFRANTDQTVKVFEMNSISNMLKQIDKIIEKDI